MIKTERLGLRKKNSSDFYENDDSRASIVGNLSSKKEQKQLEIYREFVKMFLKIKFERLDNDHTGQKISQNDVWMEVKKQNVNKDQWKDFILTELKNFKKYEEMKKTIK